MIEIYAKQRSGFLRSDRGFPLLHQFAEEEEAAGVECGGVEAGGVVDGLFALGEDGGFVGLVAVDFDFDAVDGVGEVAGDEEGGKPVAGAVGVEPRDGAGRLVVERDDDLSAVGADDVVDGGACAFEGECEGFAGGGGFVEVWEFGEAGGEGVFCAGFGKAGGEGGFLDGNEARAFVVVGAQGLGERVGCGCFSGVADGGE